MHSDVVHEASGHRFRVEMNGGNALLNYMRDGGTIVFTHTEVPPAMEGKGIGGELARAGLEYAREHGLRVVARCPFVASYLQRHPEYEGLVQAE
jgi:predicted GNAT family acetyltransferase